MAEIPKAASSVHYNKEIEEEEENKEKQKTKGRLSYSLPSGPDFSEGGKPQGSCWKPPSLWETWPLEVKPKAPCPKCKEPDHWVCGCPGS